MMKAYKRKRQLVEEKSTHLEITVLLPNGGSVILNEERDEELKVEELLRKIRRRVDPSAVDWNHNIYLEDLMGNNIQNGEIFSGYEGCTSRTIALQDGQPNAVHGLEDMWNVTPVPELLDVMPQDYTLETALADLLDNSLQAVWANPPGQRRLISLKLSKDKITIFDSGQGMDSSQTNSIAKWGTMGSSKHRSVRESAIGGDPPYLKPYFGMYGFGGLIAAMSLARIAVVSSKTKASKKVVSLTLERDKLFERCKMDDRTWKTPGEFRDPTKEEVRESPHGTFTKVELTNLNGEVWKEHQLMCMLKDIYFPYIQCDTSDSSQKTTTPVEFEVNQTNLAEIEGGEFAVTNMSSCNGPPFVIDLHLKKMSNDSNSGSKAGHSVSANARITCFYYPIQQGKEAIDFILEELEKQEIGVNESFENFCRVSIRRLGRLLPAARWKRLPFMEPKRKRMDKSSIPKICFERVKAFIDTDAGFVPTTSKMDLSSGHAFTNVLKNLGSRGLLPDGVTLEVLCGERSVSANVLEKEYEGWLRDMHEHFDEEVDCEEDAIEILTSKMEEFGFSKDVCSVFKCTTRKGITWKQGMRLKFLKGIPGQMNKDFYATLEYFLADGLIEDRGNAKVVCRPLEVQKSDGSTLIIGDAGPIFHIGQSKALSIDFLTPEKCISLTEEEWTRVEEKRLSRYPARIDVLNHDIAKRFGLDGGIEQLLRAGSKPPSEIVAVVRPHNYVKASKEGRQVNPTEQKYIVKKMMQMKLEVRCMGHHGTHEATGDERAESLIMLTTPKTIHNLSGLYCFTTAGTKLEDLYKKAGKHTFIFELVDDECADKALNETVSVQILPSDKIGHWDLDVMDDCEAGKGKLMTTTRLGSSLGPLILTCYDEFGNSKAIRDLKDVKLHLWSNNRIMDVNVSIEGIQYEQSDGSVVIKAIHLSNGILDGIAADYMAVLKLTILDVFAASFNLYVLPGEMASIQLVESQRIDNCLRTGDIIRALTLQVIDSYGNPVHKGCKVSLKLVGVELQDSEGNNRMVDERGCIRLGGLLKVTGALNTKAKISVYSGDKICLYEREFYLLRRTLWISSAIQREYCAGGILQDVKIQIVDENGFVDRKMDGPQHMIMLHSSPQNAYPLKEGVCCIHTLKLPNKVGLWSDKIFHSTYHELEAQLQVNLVCGILPPSNDCNTSDNDVTSNVTPLMIRDTSGSEAELEALADDIINLIESANKDIKLYANKVKKAEDELRSLTAKRDHEVDKISRLEVEIAALEKKSLKVHAGKTNDLDKNDCTQEKIARKISSCNAPAKFLLEAQCSGMFLSQQTGRPEVKDILGVVALLASTNKPSLSRILAEFVDMENMLAVVCKTREAANVLVKHNEVDGKVDKTWGLYKFADSQRKSMQEKLRVYVLEEMRCYEHGFDENHPQKVLKFKDPQLSDGASPPGFLGYAANLLHVHNEYLDLQLTADGHGLRGSLFYNLFEELQVYDSRMHLLQARSALTSGGVSLDGSVIHRRGCEDHGSRDGMLIPFPVMTGNLSPVSLVTHIYERVKIDERLRTAKQELEERKNYIDDQIEERRSYVQRKVEANRANFLRTTQDVQSQTKRLDILRSRIAALHDA